MRKTIILLTLLMTFGFAKAQYVSVCRNCSLVHQYNYDRLFPDNKRVSQSCSSWEGHLWYNAGSSGQNKFKCQVCTARVSIREKKPKCMTFCEIACRGKKEHQWAPVD